MPLFIVFLLIGMLSACQSLIPATTPPQLSHTRSAAITITDNVIDGGWFTLDYPEGWRVVTNVAIEPLSLTLVSPDDTMVIRVDEVSACLIPEVTPEPNTYWRDDCPSNDNSMLHISGTPETEFQAIYDPIFDAVVNSVRFR